MGNHLVVGSTQRPVDLGFGYLRWETTEQSGWLVRLRPASFFAQRLWPTRSDQPVWGDFTATWGDLETSWSGERLAAPFCHLYWSGRGDGVPVEVLRVGEA